MIGRNIPFDVDGIRYIERITELIRLDSQEYPAYDPNDPVNSMNRITREYYTRMTDRKMFTTQDIIRLNPKTATYEPVQWFSEELTRHIFARIPENERSEWKKWIRENWGARA